MGGEWQFTDFYDIPQFKFQEKPRLKQYTDITVLLDRSGSMQSIKPAMESAFNEFIQGHKVNPTTKVTLIQFDDGNDQDVVFQSVPVGAVEKLILHPRGGTPLVDAFVKTIDRTGDRLRGMAESDRPDQVLLVVITDGQENASRLYKRSDVASRVTKQSTQFNWQFVYLGANQDAIREAQSYGIGQQHAITYTPSFINTMSVGNALMSNTVAYATEQGALRGGSARGFTKAQRSAAMDTDDDLNTVKTTTSDGTF